VYFEDGLAALVEFGLEERILAAILIAALLVAAVGLWYDHRHKL
jgi:hypothetical protein